MVVLGGWAFSHERGTPVGTATAPFAQLFTVSAVQGQAFTPTAEETAQSVRVDRRIRLRAAVRLFLERNTSGCCLQ